MQRRVTMSAEKGDQRQVAMSAEKGDHERREG